MFISVNFIHKYILVWYVHAISLCLTVKKRMNFHTLMKHIFLFKYPCCNDHGNKGNNGWKPSSCKW